MTSTHKGMTVVIVSLIFLMVGTGCGQGNAPATAAAGETSPTARPFAAIPSPTPTPTTTPSPTITPSPTSSPTPTPTPTPTALPLAVSGDPLAPAAATPAAQPGAPCGVVDWLDFPLDPPDAKEIDHGGRDFGMYRRWYGGYHTGEDWWGSRGQSAFGMPVYAIGHGRITYAEPVGWGRDQGVVIVRHILADGSTFLSFYGHLDPESVTGRAGDCVSRGEQVGAIGRPRTGPHLHFEIRTHMPTEPGPGYWSEDFILAGWRPPSQTIWESRMAVLPGVGWTRPYSDTLEPVGMAREGILAVIEGSRLVGMNVADGSVAWQYGAPGRVAAATVDPTRPLLYTADRSGRVQAFHLPEPQIAATAIISDPLWVVEPDVFGTPALHPLPGGGVVLSVWQELFALSPAGELLWQHELPARPLGWALLDDRLLLTTVAGSEESLWTLDERGASPWRAAVGGYPVQADDRSFLYNAGGIYRLNPTTRTVALIYPLPRGLLSRGDIVALPDGGVLVTHMDAADRRLIRLDADGTIRWERSYADAVAGTPDLVRVGDDVYLVAHESDTGWGEVSVFAVDLERSDLTLLFTGGTRTPRPGETWVVAIEDGRLLLNIGGGPLIAFDPSVAIKWIGFTLYTPHPYTILASHDTLSA